MPSHVQQAELFGEGPLSFELDGVVIPDDHSVFKLFPGKSYRLAKVMRETSFAFLDIQGLTTLPGHPLEWDDLDILNVISLDRMMREGESHGVRKRKRSGSEQDKKRLRFLKNLFFTAKRGDLILVPLGEGYSSQIAIGELQVERFQAYCRARQKVEDEATVRPPARLKSPAKKPK